jgi:hypothetical protein
MELKICHCKLVDELEIVKSFAVGWRAVARAWINSKMPVQSLHHQKCSRVQAFSSPTKPSVAGRSRVCTKSRSRVVSVLASSDKLALLSPSKVLLHN